MKLLLIRPVSKNDYQIVPNIGLGYLATAVRRKGHDVGILDCVREGMSIEGFSRHLEQNHYDIIGIQIFSCDLSGAREMFDRIKNRDTSCITIAGGPHVSALPRETLEEIPACDYAFTGEGETGLTAFMDALTEKKFDDNTRRNIPSLNWRTADGVRSNPSVITGFESGIWPAWDLIDPRGYQSAPRGTLVRNLPVAPVQISKGCPNRCSYCAGFLTTGRRVRYRDPSDFLNEISMLHDDYGVREIEIRGDNPTFDKNRYAELCRILRDSNLGLSWSHAGGICIESLDRELLELMEESGCYSISLGIESTSPKIQARMGRKTPEALVRQKIKLIRKYTRIRVTGFFMLGYPGETLAEMKQTVKFALSLPIDRAQFSNFRPLPGTPVFRELESEGRISRSSIHWEELTDHFLSFVPEGIESNAYRRLYRSAFLRFYLKPRIILGLLREIHSISQLKTILLRAIAIMRTG